MLFNCGSLQTLALDPTYPLTLEGKLYVHNEPGTPTSLLHMSKWNSRYAILKANMLFIFKSKPTLHSTSPCQLLIMEDVFVDVEEENCGKPYAFSIKYRTSGRELLLAADNDSNQQHWISSLATSDHHQTNSRLLAKRDSQS